MKWLYRKVRDIVWEYCSKREEKERWEKIIKAAEPTDDSIYYIIRRPGNPGLFSYVEITLLQVSYALKHNMIPIVDMKNYKNTYHEEYEVGHINAWELFFKQLCNKELEEVLRKEKYVLSCSENIDWHHVPCLDGYYSKREYCFWSMLYERYVKLSDSAQKYFDREYNEILKDKADRTLGVLVRGTDYKFAKGHAVQPDVDEVIIKVRHVMRKRNYQFIYLATEEFAVVERFRKEFKGCVITNRRMYFDQFEFSADLQLNDIKINRDHDSYWRGMEYLSSICLLSKCGGLVAGACGGSYGAFYMNGGAYRYTYFFDLGTVK